MKMTVDTKLVVAALAAAIVAAPSMADTTQNKTGQVKCAGINTCKDKSECASATNGCKGQNACKKKGWIFTTAQTCKNEKGTVIGSN